MTAPNTGSAGLLSLDVPTLNSIIAATGEAIGQMAQLNGAVSATAGDIHRASQSTAGQIMNNRLAVWNEDFRAITEQLRILDQRAQQLRTTLISAGNTAAQAAGSGQS